MLMIVTTAFSYNPVLNLHILNDELFHKEDPTRWWYRHKVYEEFLAANRGINLVFASIGQLFYVWATAHSYGILEEKDRPNWIRFYLPKMSVLFVYSALRLLFRFHLRISPSKLPGITIVSMLRNFSTIYPSIKQWPRNASLQVIGFTVVELIFVVCLVRRMILTGKRLANAEYLKYRSKQIGFRFFVMQNIIAYTLFILADTAVTILLPREFSVKFFLGKPFAHFLFNWRFGPVPRFINYCTTVVTAFVNLPADSIGWKGWILGSGLSPDLDPQPISLSVRCSKGSFNKIFLASNMVLHDQVHLLNLSSIAYNINRGNPHRVAMCKKYLFETDCQVELQLYEEKSKNFVLVVSSFDRISVAFKGTTDIENFKTDMKVSTTHVSAAIPTIQMEDISGSILQTSEWKAARLHHGFVEAYLGLSDKLIAKLSDLVFSVKKPIYLTGHSLGGALATICSIDIVLSLGVTDVYVCTFGSPRCGNLFWAQMYDNLVPIHWRVALRSDVITALPRMAYSHVGKRVALSTRGDMFLDPNAIETSLWSSSVMSLSDHKKPAYMDSIELFAEKYVSDFQPEFLRLEEESMAEVRIGEKGDMITLPDETCKWETSQYRD